MTCNNKSNILNFKRLRDLLPAVRGHEEMFVIISHKTQIKP